MSESTRLPREKSKALRELGWSFPNRRKAKRPRRIPSTELVDLSDEEFVEGGKVPVVDVERVA